MEAGIDQLVGEIKQLAKDQAEMEKASSDAQRMRQQEQNSAKTSLTQYRDAQKMLTSAIGLLQKFYQQAPGDSDASDSGFKANSMGSGIIGMLQVAQDDYAQLEKDLSLNEDLAAKDFDSFMKESEIRLTVVAKDLEGKGRAKVALEGNRMRTRTDLKSSQTQLEAVTTYLDELKASCTIKGDTYEERQARRQKELGGLRDALGYLR